MNIAQFALAAQKYLFKAADILDERLPSPPSEIAPRGYIRSVHIDADELDRLRRLESLMKRATKELIGHRDVMDRLSEALISPPAAER